MLACAVTLTGCTVNIVIPNIVIGTNGTNINTDRPSNDSNGDTPVVQTKYKTPTKSVEYWQDKTPEEQVKEKRNDKVVAYQFYLENVNINGENTPKYYSVVMNLYEDGFASIAQYNTDSKYVTDYYGYWTSINDEHLYVGFTNHTNSTQPGVIYGISYSFELVEADGAFETFGINLALGFGEGGVYVRNYDVSGDGKVTFATLTDFEKKIGYVRADAPAEETPAEAKILFSFDSGNENNLMDIYDDGTYVFTFKSVGLTDKGTWAWENGKFTITDKEGHTCEATKEEDNSLKLEYTEYVTSKGKVKRTFVCEHSIWSAALDGKTETEASVLFAFTSDSENYLLDVYTDGTYVFTFKTAGLTDKGTWTWQGWNFALTDSKGNVTEATKGEDHSLNLTYVEHNLSNGRVTRDFTCPSSVWGPAFNGQGDYQK